ncbi:MAG TPA: hypothetical protein VMV40_02240 [Acidiferrobacter sp.]|nr:hypothetical protein [Acidiferrobacter sp.]
MNSASLVANFLGYLSPRGVYTAAAPIAHTLMTTVTPSLFVIALYIRLLETQSDAVMGMGRFSQAIKDIAVWGVILVVYFSAGNLIAHYLNALYAEMARIGSLHTVALQMAALLKTADKTPSGSWSTIKEINALPMRIATVLLYYATLVITTFLEALLRIAQAIGYEVAFLYGLIAIPLAISRTISLMRGFAKLMGFFVLWPVIQALLLAVFSPIFTQAIADLQQLLGPSDYMIVYAHMLFTILNLILCAVLLAAPYITASLVENAGAAQPILSPYIGALTGMGMTMAMGVGQGAARMARPFLEDDPEITSIAPGPVDTLHVPRDPDYWPTSADATVPLTNYLDPEFDAPAKDERDGID